jgi:hypothetical protein
MVNNAVLDDHGGVGVGSCRNLNTYLYREVSEAIVGRWNKMIKRRQPPPSRK